MSTQVKVSKLPKCDLCAQTAAYDAKTIQGPWAYMCRTHFEQLGIGLGTGYGQRLVLEGSE